MDETFLSSEMVLTGALQSEKANTLSVSIAPFIMQAIQFNQPATE